METPEFLEWGSTAREESVFQITSTEGNLSIETIIQHQNPEQTELHSRTSSAGEGVV